MGYTLGGLSLPKSARGIVGSSHILYITRYTTQVGHNLIDHVYCIMMMYLCQSMKHFACHIKCASKIVAVAFICSGIDA